MSILKNVLYFENKIFNYMDLTHCFPCCEQIKHQFYSLCFQNRLFDLYNTDEILFFIIILCLKINKNDVS